MARSIDHPNRHRLLAIIEARPGIHLRSLVAAGGLGNGNTRHHMAVLSAAGLVTTRRAGRRLHCFPSAGFDESTWRARAVRADPQFGRLVELVASRGGARGSELVEAARRRWAWSRTVTRDRLRRLVEHGVLAPPRRAGGAYRLA